MDTTLLAHLALGAAADEHTALDRDLFIFFISGLVRIKGSRPHEVDVLDQFLRGAGW